MPKYMYPIYEQHQDTYLVGVAKSRKEAEKYVAKKGRYFVGPRAIPILGEKRKNRSYHGK
jgi:hypothetical protein